MVEYKNTSPYTLEIPEVGVVEPGKTITTDRVLESQHLEKVEAQVAAPTPTPAPVAVAPTPAPAPAQPQPNPVAPATEGAN